MHNFEIRAFFVLVNNLREKPWSMPHELNEFVVKLKSLGLKNTRLMRAYIVSNDEVPNCDEPTTKIIKKLF